MFCSSCGTANDDAAKFCQKCGSKLAAAGNAPTHQAPADDRLRGGGPPRATGEKRYATGKNPVLAAILCLIPGVGQFYNGDMKKGGIMFAVNVVGNLLTFGWVWLPMVIWSAIDAYQVASGKSAMW
jgi:TM2 domain-containing membrane protein YozV